MHVVFIIRGIVNSWTRLTTKTTKIGSPRIKSISQYLKAVMKSYIPLETAAIFFLVNLFPKQGISSEYVMVDFIYTG